MLRWFKYNVLFTCSWTTLPFSMIEREHLINWRIVCKLIMNEKSIYIAHNAKSSYLPWCVDVFDTTKVLLCLCSPVMGLS